ncbi:MAG: hypothetical protein ABJC50_06500, partial [Nonlabens ulvanivorans]
MTYHDGWTIKDMKTVTYYPKLEDVKQAANRLRDVACLTPLELNTLYSEKYQSSIYFKREDL